jgi:diguanylate cyclase (GGDEF)-like protein/PAS domain S-box-containing protein
MDVEYAQRRTRLVILILGITTLFLWSSAYLIFLQQRDQMLETHRSKTARESELIAQFLSEALLRNDYAEARNFLHGWQRNHAYVTALSAHFDNGRSLFVYRNGDNESLASGNLEQVKLVPYNNRILTLSVTHESADIEAALGRLARNLALLSGLLVLLLGGTLWFVLFRWSVKPMEEEIARRTQALREAIDYAHSLIYSMSGNIAIIDETGHILDTNRSWREFARNNGYSGDGDMIGLCYFNSCRDLDRIAREGEPWERAIIKVLRGELDEYSIDYPCHSDQEQRWYLMHVAPVSYHGERRAILNHINITEIKKVQEALARSEDELLAINRVYQALSASNKALSTAQDERQLLTEVARIIYEDCGFPLVWIGYGRYGEDKSLKTKAVAGPKVGFLDGTELSWGEGQDATSGPIGDCYRNSRPVIKENCLEFGDADPWCARALEHGIVASAAFPVHHGGASIGVIAVYSDTRDAFSPQVVALLTELSANLAFGVLAIRERQARALAQQELERISVTDKLTQLFNRLRTDAVLEAEVGRAERYGVKLSVILFDIDHFKQINDSRGHQFGDLVLTGLADELRSNVRENDVAGRWGGEEFLVITPHTELEGAVKLAEKLRQRIQTRPFGDTHQQPVTASFGVAEWHQGDSAGTLLGRADRALYRAKHNGRNRVEREILDGC